MILKLLLILTFFGVVYLYSTRKSAQHKINGTATDWLDRFGWGCTGFCIWLALALAATALYRFGGAILSAL